MATGRSPEPDKLAKVAERRALEREVQRKSQARQRPDRGAWFGLGMFGLVGWAVAIPTIGGIALGLFIDGRSNGDRSWTMALLLAGVTVGCLNAWYWVQKESRDD